MPVIVDSPVLTTGSIAEPMGPGHNNITNVDGTTLSYFQRSDMPITGDAASIVFNALLGSQVVHESNLTSFTTMLNNCSFFVQGYDNSKLVCFGAIRILNSADLKTLSLNYQGYGVNPYGQTAYGGGFSYKDIFGELCYVYQDAAYAGDSLSTKVVDLLIQSQEDFVNVPSTRQLFCLIPETVPSSQDYDYIRYLQSSSLSNKGVTFSNRGIAATATNPYHNVTSANSILYTFYKSGS